MNIHNKNTLLIFGVLAALFAAGLAYYQFFYKDQQLQEFIVSVSGVVEDPRSGQPVAGVDLVAGDTRIRTADSGQFLFGAVSSESGIELTHPNLLRAFRIIPQSKTGKNDLVIFFDESLLNTLVTIVDREARGQLHEVYGSVHPVIQKDVTESSFTQRYASLYGEEDINDQHILVSNIQRDQNATYIIDGETYTFTDVYTFTLINNSEEKDYMFTPAPFEMLGEQDSSSASNWSLIPVSVSSTRK